MKITKPFLLFIVFLPFHVICQAVTVSPVIQAINEIDPLWGQKNYYKRLGNKKFSNV